MCDHDPSAGPPPDEPPASDATIGADLEGGTETDAETDAGAGPTPDRDPVIEWAILDIVERAPGLTEPELVARFEDALRLIPDALRPSLWSLAAIGCRDDAVAHQLLVWLRWPDGVRCPHCGAAATTILNRMRWTTWRCEHCHRPFTLRTASPMGRHRLWPKQWWYLLWAAMSGGVTIAQFARAVGISLPTARVTLYTVRRLAGIPDPERVDVPGSSRLVLTAPPPLEGRRQAS